jgi:hypothetical protein
MAEYVRTAQRVWLIGRKTPDALLNTKTATGPGLFP